MQIITKESTQAVLISEKNCFKTKVFTGVKRALYDNKVTSPS